MDHHAKQPQERGFTKISVSFATLAAIKQYQTTHSLPSLNAAINHLLDMNARLESQLARTPALDRRTAKSRLRHLFGGYPQRMEPFLDALFNDACLNDA